MKLFKSLLTLSILLGALSAQAASTAAVIEHCSHDILKLVRAKQLTQETISQLQTIQVQEHAAGYHVVATLTQNETQSEVLAHMNFEYDQNAKMVSFEYIQGSFSLAASPFVKKSAAKLFDIASEVLQESDEKVLSNFSKTVVLMHLSYDAVRNAAVFEMTGANNEQLHVLLDLDGQLLEYKLIPVVD